jgi:MFS family permease
VTRPPAASPPVARPAAVRIIFLALFLDLLGFGIVIPPMPYYARECGADGTVVGAIGAVYSLLQFLMAPFWGRVSDRRGRRPVILIGLVGSAASYVVFGAAFHLAAWTGVPAIAILLVSRAIAGFFNANLAAAQAYLADVTPAKDRAAAMGLVGAAFGLGFVLGPAFSAVLWRLSGSVEVPFYAAAVIGLAAFVWALGSLPESRDPGAAAGAGTAPGASRAAEAARGARALVALARVPRGPLRTVLSVWFLSTVAMGAMENTLGLFVEAAPPLRFQPDDFALLLLFLGVAVALTQGVAVRRLSRRFREEQLVSAGSVVMAASLALTPWVRGAPDIYLAMGALCFGYGLVSPSLASLASLLADEDRRGEVLGLGQSMASLGRIVGPAGGGALYEHAGHGSPYLAGGAVCAACLVLGLRLVRPVVAGAAAAASGAAVATPSER